MALMGNKRWYIRYANRKNCKNQDVGRSLGKDRGKSQERECVSRRLYKNTFGRKLCWIDLVECKVMLISKSLLSLVI